MVLSRDQLGGSRRGGGAWMRRSPRGCGRGSSPAVRSHRRSRGTAAGRRAACGGGATMAPEPASSRARRPSCGSDPRARPAVRSARHPAARPSSRPTRRTRATRSQRSSANGSHEVASATGTARTIPGTAETATRVPRGERLATRRGWSWRQHDRVLGAGPRVKGSAARSSSAPTTSSRRSASVIVVDLILESGSSNDDQAG